MTPAATSPPEDAGPAPAAAGRMFGLRLALALTLFETLLALALGHSRVSGLLAGALFFLLPFTVYGVILFAVGGWLLRARWMRVAAVVALLGFHAWLFLRFGQLTHLRGGGLGAISLVLLAFVGAAVCLVGSLRPRILKLASFHAWAVTVVLFWLWSGRSDDVRFGLPPEHSAAGPNVVLISWDTVRADVLSPYGGTGLATPNLDALAARSVVFDQAIAAAPITGPSHASMLTGLYPPTHGLRSNGTTMLSPDAPFLPEILHAGGWNTGAFVSAYPLLARFGLYRGFQVYDDRLPNRLTSDLQDFGIKSFLWLQALLPFVTSRNASSPAGDVVNERALEWYEQTEGAKFAWIHYYDAHGPFDPREPYRAEALAAAARATPRAVDPGEGQEKMTLQRGEIAWLDHLLGEIVAGLERSDPGLQNTIVILTSDHGECFGEGGIIGEHVPSLYEATQHVPLIVHLPGGELGGRRVSEQVCHIDLAPTLLEWLTVLPPGPEEGGPMQGLSLLAAMHGEGGVDREWLYLEAYQNSLREERKQAVRSSEWKFVRWLNDVRNLYDLAQGDSIDLFEPGFERVGELEVVLEEKLNEIPVAEGTARVLSGGEMAALDSLGYAGREEDPQEASEEQ